MLLVLIKIFTIQGNSCRVSISIPVSHQSSEAHGCPSSLVLVLCYAPPHYSTPQCTAPHRTTPHCIAPHRITPRRTAPHRTAPRRTAPHTAFQEARNPFAPSSHLTLRAICFYFLGMSVWLHRSGNVCVPGACLVPSEARRECWNLYSGIGEADSS